MEQLIVVGVLLVGMAVSRVLHSGLPLNLTACATMLVGDEDTQSGSFWAFLIIIGMLFAMSFWAQSGLNESAGHERTHRENVADVSATLAVIMALIYQVHSWLGGTDSFELPRWVWLCGVVGIAYIGLRERHRQGQPVANPAP